MSITRVKSIRWNKEDNVLEFNYSVSNDSMPYQWSAYHPRGLEAMTRNEVVQVFMSSEFIVPDRSTLKDRLEYLREVVHYGEVSLYDDAYCDILLGLKRFSLETCIVTANIRGRLYILRNERLGYKWVECDLPRNANGLMTKIPRSCQFYKSEMRALRNNSYFNWDNLDYGVSLCKRNTECGIGYMDYDLG